MWIVQVEKLGVLEPEVAAEEAEAEEEEEEEEPAPKGASCSRAFVCCRARLLARGCCSPEYAAARQSCSLLKVIGFEGQGANWVWAGAVGLACQ